MNSAHAKDGADALQQCLGYEEISKESRMYGDRYSCTWVSRCTGKFYYLEVRTQQISILGSKLNFYIF